MDKQVIQSLLLQLVRSALTGDQPDNSVIEQLTAENMQAVYVLAQRHSLGHIVRRFVFANGIETDPGLDARFQRDELITVYRYERMQYTLREVCDTFERLGIAYIPLKGSALRPFYPDESIRVSCDIDILVHECDLDAALKALASIGYSVGKRHFHDVSLFSPNGIHLELHFSIQENRESLDLLLKNAWQYAVQSEGCCFAFRKDFFVLYIYAHMVFHFVSGGCGIRSLMDIWVMEHRMDMPYSVAEDLLKKAGIYRFAAEMSMLAARCLDENDSSDPLLAYIWRGGTYGSRENGITFQKNAGVSSFSYILRRIFLPYKSMVIPYPVLKKVPVLLPLCWVMRAIRLLFKGKATQMAKEIVCLNSISAEAVLEIEEACIRLGL